MDPISLDISSAAIIYAGKSVVRNLHQSQSRLDAAPEEIRNPLDEVLGFEATLQTIYATQEDPAEPLLGLSAAVSTARGRLESLSYFVYHILNKGHVGRGGDHLKCMRKKDSIDWLQECLHVIGRDMESSTGDIVQLPRIQRISSRPAETSAPNGHIEQSKSEWWC